MKIRVDIVFWRILYINIIIDGIKIELFFIFYLWIWLFEEFFNCLLVFREKMIFYYDIECLKLELVEGMIVIYFILFFFLKSLIING